MEDWEGVFKPDDAGLRQLISIQLYLLSRGLAFLICVDSKDIIPSYCHLLVNTFKYHVFAPMGRFQLESILGSAFITGGEGLSFVISASQLQKSS